MPCRSREYAPAIRAAEQARIRAALWATRSDFHWDRKRGAYICPNGKLLKTSGTVHDGRTLLYRASKRDCDVCPIRAKCCTTADARKIPREAVLNCI